MKKILLLGDSIRLGYQPFVKKALEGTAEVVGSEDNGRYAKHTLGCINLWLNEFGSPDIIHWNNGLWDLHHVQPSDEAVTPLEEYLQTLKRIIKILEWTGARIIFATTTPISTVAKNKSNDEIREYNEAAIKLSKANNIEINDLNGLISKDIDRYICEDGLHLTEEGYQKCSGAIVGMVEKYL